MDASSSIARRPALALLLVGAGSALRGSSAAAQAGPAAGRVIAVLGSVRAVGTGGPRNLAVGGPVFERDTITTGPGAKVRIVCFNGPIVTLGPDSEVAVERLAASSATGVSALFRLASGIVRLVGGAITGPTELTVETSGALAAARSTDWLVESTENGWAVFVAEGRVQVTGRTSGMVELTDGEGVDVVNGVPQAVRVWGDARRTRALGLTTL
jgi:ferric-dicitrate binding protein FerR (iron transport regulator)